VGCCCREAQRYAIDTQQMSKPRVSQDSYLGFLLDTFCQISCFCSHGFSSSNAQSIAPVLLCLPPLSPAAQLLPIATSAGAVKPSALFNTIKSDFLSSPSSHRCYFSFLQLLEPLLTDGQNLGSMFNFFFRKTCKQFVPPRLSLALPIPQQMIALFR